MIVRTFERQDGEYGEGWLMIGAPSSFVPSSGVTIAHDILEHRRGDKGTCEEELMALGASLYIRGIGGFWEGNPGEVIADDILNEVGMHYEAISNGIQSHREIQLKDKEVEGWISAMNKEIEKTMSVEKWWDQWSYNEPDAVQVLQYLERVPDWLRAGFLGAQKRYAKSSLDSHTLARMSRIIADQSDKLLWQAELGFRMRVRVDLQTAHVDCSIVYPKGY